MSDQDLSDPAFDAYIKALIGSARSDAPSASGLPSRSAHRPRHALRYAAAVVVATAAASIAVVLVRSGGATRHQISPVAPSVTTVPSTTVPSTAAPTTAAPTSAAPATSVVVSLDAFCVDLAPRDIERPESYIGSAEQIADIDGLIALAPADVSEDLATLRIYLASGAITAADPESNVIVNWPPEVQAAVMAVADYRTTNCPAMLDPNAPLEVRHLEHDAFAAELPPASALTWLPSDVSADDDSDLTQRLDAVDCGGVRSTTPSREDSATNRQYTSGQASLMSITFYDVETVADAQQYIASVQSFFECPNPPTTFTRVDLTDLTTCEDSIAIRTAQPVSETIDAWCRVANLIAYVRLYPTGAESAEVPPTDEQATQTMITVGDALRTAWAAAG